MHVTEGFNIVVDKSTMTSPLPRPSRLREGQRHQECLARLVHDASATRPKQTICATEAVHLHVREAMYLHTNRGFHTRATERI